MGTPRAACLEPAERGLARHPIRNGDGTKMTTSMEDRAVHHLELEPLGIGAWRLCDRDVGDDDPASVVAYLEETGRGIEVVWLHGRGGRSTFAHVGEVLEAAAIVLIPAAGTRSQRPVAIPHFAPKSPPR